MFIGVVRSWFFFIRDSDKIAPRWRIAPCSSNFPVQIYVFILLFIFSTQGLRLAGTVFHIFFQAKTGMISGVPGNENPIVWPNRCYLQTRSSKTKYSRHSVNSSSVNRIIQLTDFYQSGNWMVELDIYRSIDHSVTGLFVRYSGHHSVTWQKVR